MKSWAARARRLPTLLATVALSIYVSTVSGQEVPVDPVSGLAIPMLPNQFYVKNADGCWIVTDEALGYWLDSGRFRGACKFGVIDGVNLVKNSYGNFRQRAEYGELLRVPANDQQVYAPRTSTHDLLEVMSIFAREIEPTSAVRSTKAEDAAVSLVLYESWRNRTQTTQDLQVRKVLCPSQDYRGNYLGKSDLKRELNDDSWISREDLPRLVDFCWEQLTRLKRTTGGRQLTFANVDYGYYFFVGVFTAYYSFPPDGRQQNGQRLLQVTHLCPNPGSLTGCESVWQKELAPFLARFDDLKAREAALLEQHRGETRQRFAPLAQAWRTRLLALTAKAPTGAK